MTTLLLGFYADDDRVLVAVPSRVYQAYRRDRFFDKAASVVTFLFDLRPGDRPRRVPQAASHRALGAVPPHRRQGLPMGGPRRALPQLLPAGADAGDPARRRARRGCCARHGRSRCRPTSSAWPGPRACRPGAILWRHALRNSLFSLITAIGFQLGALSAAPSSPRRSSTSTAWARCWSSPSCRSDLFTVQAIVGDPRGHRRVRQPRRSTCCTR